MQLTTKYFIMDCEVIGLSRYIPWFRWSIYVVAGYALLALWHHFFNHTVSHLGHNSVARSAESDAYYIETAKHGTAIHPDITKRDYWFSLVHARSSGVQYL